MVTQVPISPQEEMEEAVQAAQTAFTEWRNSTPLTRQRLMLDLQKLIRDNSVHFNFYFFLQIKLKLKLELELKLNIFFF